MQEEPTVGVVFKFGPFRLIPSQRALLRENRAVKLGGRALDILHLLVMRAGEEVSKNALIEFAWPDVFVDDANLKVHISSLRRALEDTLPSSTYVATVAGRGYQFVARVETERGKIPNFFGEYQSVARSLPERSRLIGRQRDAEAVARALDFTSLLTIVGPGGVGKTSLAIEVAHSRYDEFPDGIYFVDLSATSDPALVPHLIATCLGVHGDPGELISAVTEHLRHRRILIVLDNSEHVLHAIAVIAERLVDAKIRGCLLVTSREPLGVLGENLQRLEPLTFPQRADVRTSSDALAYSSVELFALRAFERSGYRLIDLDAPAVARLCQALEGLPLAIEIAAANLDQFSPLELLNSFGRHLGELGNDDGASHARHRTLWAALDWSYHLLSTQEATLFQLLSVFAGSFEWTDVASMARLVQYDPYQTTTALGGLVAKSLLSAEIDGEELRYRLFATASSYAADRLLQNPLARDAQRQHAQTVLSVFEKSEAEWSRVDNRVWRVRYEARTGDLRKALDWCFGDGGDASLGVDLAVSAIRLWNEQSSIFEQLAQVERALNHCASIADASQRKATLAMSRAKSMTFVLQLHAETDDAWNTAVNFGKDSGDVSRQLSAMCGKGIFLVWTGRFEQAVNLFNEVIHLAVHAGDRASMFEGERLRALAEMHLGKLVKVRAEFERLAEDHAHGMPRSKYERYQLHLYVSIHGWLAFSTWLTGKPERALAIAEDVVSKTGQIGQLMGQSKILAVVAMPLALWSGKADALERYSVTLRSNLDSENMAIWEPVYRFYASVTRHARGDLIAVDDMRLAIEELVRVRLLFRVPMYFGVLAEALLSMGRYEEAREAIESAFKLKRQSRENWCLPELLRVKAKILTVLGEREHARTMLGRARVCSLAIGARSLELRIVNDLADMASADGKKEDALELLAPLYESFEEKTATEDLKRSSRLLSAAEAN